MDIEESKKYKREYSRKWNEKNRERRREINKRYREKDRKQNFKIKRDWQEKNRSLVNGYVRLSRLKRLYGLNLEDIQIRLAQQESKCPICLCFLEKPVCDHNHVTGAIRDLLCALCNSTIGFARENIDVLERAAIYLRRHNKKDGVSEIEEFQMATKKHHKFTHTTVTHHDDGSHTVKHHHEDGKSHKEYATADHDGMMDGMMDNTSAPNPGEAEAQAGPAPGAGPGAIPGGLAGVPPGV